MDRSFAARAGSARVTGSAGWALPRGRRLRPRTRALARRVRSPRVLLALALLPALGGGWLWLRDSPLVAVERVQISGVQGPDAGPIEGALRAAALHTSTLDVNMGALRAAVAPFRVVRSLSVSASPPHALRIQVVEQQPVAVLTQGGARTAVAADGAVLGPDLASSSLAVIAAAGPPPRNGRVGGTTVRAELAVLGAAPQVLLGWVARVEWPPARGGLTVVMRGGLQIYFGDATRPHAKWLAAARVLADPSSAGATYLDVRAPERPAAGSAAAEGSGSSSPSSASVGAGGTDPNTSALARALAEALTDGPSTPGVSGQTPASTSGQTPAGETQQAPAGTIEQASSATEQAPASATEQASSATEQAPASATEQASP